MGTKLTIQPIIFTGLVLGLAQQLGQKHHSVCKNSIIRSAVLVIVFSFVLSFPILHFFERSVHFYQCFLFQIKEEGDEEICCSAFFFFRIPGKLYYPVIFPAQQFSTSTHQVVENFQNCIKYLNLHLNIFEVGTILLTLDSVSVLQIDF